MKRTLRAFLIFFAALITAPAMAQSACPNVIAQGQVWTSNQWNTFFACIQQLKSDYPLTTVPANKIVGTIPAASIPAPTSSTLGGVKAQSGAAGQFVTGIDTSGNPIFGTPSGSGNVIGPSSAVSGNLPSFNGISGTFLQDSGISASSVSALSTLRAVSSNTSLTSADGTVDVDATSGAITIVAPISLGTSTQSQPIRVAKVDKSGNAVIINDGTNDVCWIFSPANGNQGSYFNVWSDGTADHCAGIN
jgi:type IV secretory pathway TrbL component